MLGRLAILFLLATLVVPVGAAGHCVRDARGHAAAKRCKRYVVAGRRTCLRVGQRCTPRLRRDYLRAKFECRRRQLVAAAGRAPQKVPGGAGGEELARSLAQLSGRGGRISPSVVQVPPFIAVRVELRSDDGRAYALRIGGRTLRVAREPSSVSVLLRGLGPGQVLRGVPVGGAGTPVRIEATFEPTM